MEETDIEGLAVELDVELDGVVCNCLYKLLPALNPDYAPAHFELAIALRQSGKSQEASEEFRRAAALDPKLIPPQP